MGLGEKGRRKGSMSYLKCMKIPYGNQLIQKLIPIHNFKRLYMIAPIPEDMCY